MPDKQERLPSSVELPHIDEQETARLFRVFQTASQKHWRMEYSFGSNLRTPEWQKSAPDVILEVTGTASGFVLRLLNSDNTELTEPIPV